MSKPDNLSEFLRPSFFILGERKCGTSSLFRYLLEHPLVLPGRRKEMQFFTQELAVVAEGFEDYLRAFPRKEATDKKALLRWPELDVRGVLYEEDVHYHRNRKSHYITGEASADTLCDGDPALLQRFLPELKLLAIFREPAARAFSHHRMLMRFQEEGRVLERRVGNFADDLQTELANHESGKPAPLIDAGLYVRNLRRWERIWGREQILVLFDTELANPSSCQKAMARVETHLGLPAHDYGEALATRFNQAPAAQLPTDIREQLRAFFEPHDRELGHHLARPVPWLAG